MRLTEAQAKQLGLTVPTASKAPRPRQRPPGYPPDVDNGHTWQRDGRGFQCQQCAIWVPAWAMPLWAHGFWREALEQKR